MKAKTVVNPAERDALRFLADEAYSALLGYKEPVRSAEIISAIGKEQYSSKLVRHVLAASPRFTQIDRRWDLEIRYEDKQRPMERVIMEVIGGYGRPMTVQQMANELSSIYERPTDYYETMAPRMLGDEEKFFRTSDGLYGLADWPSTLVHMMLAWLVPVGLIVTQLKGGDASRASPSSIGGGQAG